jgi:hypothetical protein
MHEKVLMLFGIKMDKYYIVFVPREDSTFWKLWRFSFSLSQCKQIKDLLLKYTEKLIKLILFGHKLKDAS